MGQMLVPAFRSGEADSRQRKAHSVASPHPPCVLQPSCTWESELKAAPETGAVVSDWHYPAKMM